MQESAYLFTELSWWMLKILLAPLPPEGLLRVPRQEYRNASELAAAARVIVMSAFGFVLQLKQEGFLDGRDEPLRLVCRKELFRRWQAPHLRAAPELPCALDYSDQELAPASSGASFLSCAAQRKERADAARLSRPVRRRIYGIRLRARRSASLLPRKSGPGGPQPNGAFCLKCRMPSGYLCSRALLQPRIPASR
jgi:hypothetical protein